MKLVTFSPTDSVQRIGVLAPEGSGQSVVDLQAGCEAMTGARSQFFVDMLSFLRAGVAARDTAQAVAEYVADQTPPAVTLSLGEVTLMAPVPVPESIRDFMSFEQHIINAIRVVGLKRLAPLDEWLEKSFGRRRSLAYHFNRAWYERPLYYKGNRLAVVGSDAEVRMPVYTRQFDYELEWGIFVGKQGANIDRARAGDYIGGYTIFNDFSARDIQLKEQDGRLGPAKGKDFDTGNAIGPCLVTPDELPDPYNLAMSARVNGQEWSRGSTADMYWTFEDMIAYISRSETIYPGEFFGSGTCSGAQGRGCGLELGQFLGVGDIVELEVEGIGVLRNRVVAVQR